MANIIQQLTDANGNNIYPIAYAQGGMKMDLLWTNPSPTSSFAAQTISIDLSNYNLILIVAWHATSLILYGNSLVLNGLDNQQISTANGNDTIMVRTVSVNNSGITFSAASKVTANQTGNGWCIPVYIYGIKMSYIVPTEVHGLQYTDEGNNVIQLMNNDGTDNLYSIPAVIRGTITKTISAASTAEETIIVPFGDTDYSVATSILFVNNFTNVSPYYKSKGANSVIIGAFNGNSSSITVNIDYVITKGVSNV